MSPSLLFMRLSVARLTTVVPSMLVSPPLRRIAQLCVAARLVAGFQNLVTSHIILRDVLHWLPISRCIEFRIAVWVWWSHIESAPLYLQAFYCPTSGLPTSKNLHSAFLHLQSAYTFYKHRKTVLY